MWLFSFNLIFLIIFGLRVFNNSLAFSFILSLLYSGTFKIPNLSIIPVIHSFTHIKNFVLLIIPPLIRLILLLIARYIKIGVLSVFVQIRLHLLVATFYSTFLWISFLTNAPRFRLLWVNSAGILEYLLTRRHTFTGWHRVIWTLFLLEQGDLLFHLVYLEF